MTNKTPKTKSQIDAIVSPRAKSRGLVLKCFFVAVYSMTMFCAFAPIVSAQNVNPDNILPPEKALIEESRTSSGVSLPEGAFKEQLVPAVIKILLGLAGTFALIAFSVAGVRLVVAHGNEEEIGKVKNIFMYSIVGLIIIAISYAIVYGILTLSFE